VTPLFAYRVTTPNGVTFFAVIDGKDGIADEVLSTRDGSWKPEPLLTAADLIQPEQKFNEWDIVKIDPSKLPK
jgi:hypothetical protein